MISVIYAREIFVVMDGVIVYERREIDVDNYRNF